jgi:hypothetical protein
LTRHHAFGLAVDLHDGIECGALAGGHGTGRLPPVRVSLGRIDRWPAGRARTTRELRAGDRLVFSVAHAAGAGYLLTMPELGRFLIDERGEAIVCEPAADPEWTEALLVQALPVACTLRGLEPFHASGVALARGALIICGQVTAGKSSLAAQLVAGGATLLSDDVVALDAPGGVVRAHPGARWLHLRPPEDGRVAGDRLRAIGRRAGRRRYEAPLAREPVPLRAAYLLEPGDGEPVAPHQGSGVALLAATYNLSVREPDRLRRQLELVHVIAGTVPAFRLRISPQRDARALAGSVRRHFEGELP